MVWWVIELICWFSGVFVGITLCLLAGFLRMRRRQRREVDIDLDIEAILSSMPNVRCIKANSEQIRALASVGLVPNFLLAPDGSSAFCMICKGVTRDANAIEKGLCENCGYMHGEAE